MTPRGPAWPDTQDLRLIRAAVLPPERATAAWGDWVAAGGDLDVVEGEAHRLLPQLWQNLAASGGDDPELGRLSGIYRHAWVTNHRLLRRAGLAVGALEEAGVDTMLLKGGAIVTALGRGVGTRPMSDLDVLVRPRDAARAHAVLGGLGYTARDALPLDEAMRGRHGSHLYRGDDDQIDLHWSAFAFPGDEEPLWAAAVPARLGTVATRAPAPAHQLLVTCAHGVYWEAAPLRWVADAALILQTEAPIDWDLLVAAATDRDITPDAAAALRLLREEFGLDVPAEVVDRLADAPAGRITRAAFRLRGARPQALRVALGWTDEYRRVRQRPFGPAGPPRGLLDHWRIALGFDSRRRLVPWAAGRAAATVRAG